MTPAWGQGVQQQQGKIFSLDPKHTGTLFYHFTQGCLAGQRIANKCEWRQNPPLITGAVPKLNHLVVSTHTHSCCFQLSTGTIKEPLREVGKIMYNYNNLVNKIRNIKMLYQDEPCINNLINSLEQTCKRTWISCSYKQCLINHWPSWHCQINQINNDITWDNLMNLHLTKTYTYLLDTVDGSSCPSSSPLTAVHGYNSTVTERVIDWKKQHRGKYLSIQKLHRT